MPRVLNTEILIPVIAELIQTACCALDNDYLDIIKAARQLEESPYGQEALTLILENAAFARQQRIACCQDTGTCIVFMEIGQELAWTGRPLAAAVNAAVRKGYTEGFLRMSMAQDPFNRVNTGDNTPAILHTELCPGSSVKITVMPKGGGSENLGAFTTLLPQAGEEGVINFILKTVEKAGGKPCPPIIAGIGIGGTMDYCCLLAKKALLRPPGSHHPQPEYARLEEKILARINDLGIGPLGMGGRITALAVHIETYPCHITALPVALNFQCHAARKASAVL